MSKKIIEDSCKGCDISMQAEAVCEICTKNTQLQAELTEIKDENKKLKETIAHFERGITTLPKFHIGAD